MHIIAELVKYEKVALVQEIYHYILQTRVCTKILKKCRKSIRCYAMQIMEKLEDAEVIVSYSFFLRFFNTKYGQNLRITGLRLCWYIYSYSDGPRMCRKRTRNYSKNCQL